MNSGVADKIRAAGGAVYGVTSEPQSLAERAPQEWKLDFACIGDPHHEIADTCRERGWLELFVNPSLEFLQASSTHFDPQHPKGYFQPGVLALSREGRVLYRWRSVPSRKNVGGAVARPTAEHVCSSIQRALDEAPGANDVALDADPPLDGPNIPWLLFASLLIANGWFITPRAFPQRPTGLSVRQRIGIAFARAIGFVALWLLAFATLPTLPVALALATWTAWIVPKVRWLNREFQSVEQSAR